MHVLGSQTPRLPPEAVEQVRELVPVWVEDGHHDHRHVLPEVLARQREAVDQVGRDGGGDPLPAVDAWGRERVGELS